LLKRIKLKYIALFNSLFIRLLPLKKYCKYSIGSDGMDNVNIIVSVTKKHSPLAYASGLWGIVPFLNFFYASENRKYF